MSSRLKSLSATALLALGGCAHDYVGLCASNPAVGVGPAKVMSAVYANDTRQSKITRMAETTDVPSVAVTQPSPTDQEDAALNPAPTAIPPSPEVIAMCGTDRDCQGGVTSLLADPVRKWIKSGGTHDDYRTGVRVLAFRVLRPQLDCEELTQGIHETEVMTAGSTRTEAPDSSKPAAEKTLQGVQLLARAVKVELEAEYKRRCKRPASATPPAAKPSRAASQMQPLFAPAIHCETAREIPRPVKTTNMWRTQRSVMTCSLPASQVSAVDVNFDTQGAACHAPRHVTFCQSRPIHRGCRGQA